MKSDHNPDERSGRNQRIEVGDLDLSPALPTGKGDLEQKNKEYCPEKDANQNGEAGEKKPGYITANPYTYPFLKDYRNDLKDHQTGAELVIWQYLRNKKTGHKIRRQQIIGDFIVDFVCLSKKTVIEIDGKIHEFQIEQDQLRTIHLNNMGYEVIRFTNDEVLSSPDHVAEIIKIHLNNRPDSKVPSTE